MRTRPGKQAKVASAVIAELEVMEAAIDERLINIVPVTKELIDLVAGLTRNRSVLATTVGMAFDRAVGRQGYEEETVQDILTIARGEASPEMLVPVLKGQIPDEELSALSSLTSYRLDMGVRFSSRWTADGLKGSYPSICEEAGMSRLLRIASIIDMQPCGAEFLFTTQQALAQVVFTRISVLTQIACIASNGDNPAAAALLRELAFAIAKAENSADVLQRELAASGKIAIAANRALSADGFAFEVDDGIDTKVPWDRILEICLADSRMSVRDATLEMYNAVSVRLANNGINHRIRR